MKKKRDSFVQGKHILFVGFALFCAIMALISTTLGLIVAGLSNAVVLIFCGFMFYGEKADVSDLIMLFFILLSPWCGFLPVWFFL